MPFLKSKKINELEEKIEKIFELLKEKEEKTKIKLDKLEKTEQLLNNLVVETKIKKNGYDSESNLAKIIIEYSIKPSEFVIDLNEGKTKTDETFKALSFLNLIPFRNLQEITDFIEKLKK